MKKEKSTERSREYRRSLAALHIAVMLFGMAGVMAQYVTAPAVLVAGGRVICSSLMLFFFSMVTRSSIRLQSRRDYGVVIFAGVILAIHWTTFFQSVQIASVAIGTITFSTFPLFVTFLEPVLFREKLRAQSVISAVVLMAGVMITVPEFSLENQTTLGILWGMISSLAYAVLSLANRYLSGRYAARTICLYEQGTAAVVLLPAFALVKAQWTIHNLFGIAVIGFICTAFAHSLYVSAQRKVKAQTAGLISGMETVYGIVYALLLLGEIPTAREIIGGIVILGVAVFSSLRSEK